MRQLVATMLCVVSMALTACSLSSEETQQESKAEKTRPQTNSASFYVPSEDSDIVSVIDLPANQVSAEIQTAERPANIVFVGEKAFVTHRNSNSVGVLDLQRQVMIKEIEVGSDPHGLALTKDKKHLYVTTVGDQYIYVIDTEKETVSKKIDAGSGAKTNYPSLHDNRLYVTDHKNMLVYAIENDEVMDTYQVSGPPMVSRTSSDGELLYVAASSYGKIEVFDTDTGEKKREIESGEGVTDFVITEDQSRLVATNKEENSVSVIDLVSGDLIKKIEDVKGPKHISFNSDESKVYFTLSGTDKVSSIDTELLELDSEITVGKSPHGVQLRGD